MSIEAFVADPEQLELFRGDTDIVVRRRVALGTPVPIKNKALLDLYHYWEILRPRGFLPNRAHFDMDRLRPLIGMASIIDVAPHEPMDFRIRLQGSRLPLPDYSNQAIADIASAPYREMLAADYRVAKDIGVPAYHEIADRLDYSTHSYARLILPFAADGRHVDQLFVCSVAVKFPDLLDVLDSQIGWRVFAD